MSAAKSPALSYNSQHHVVRVDLTRAAALESSKPPASLSERVRAKLEKVQNDGKIEFYEIYDEKLDSVWSALREAKDLDENLTISLTFAAGAPAIDGLEISNSDIDRPGLLVSTAGPIDTKKISLEWIRSHMIRVAREHFIHDTLFGPHVTSALQRIAAGDTLDKFLIESRTESKSFSSDGKPFSVFANRSRSEALVYVHDLKAMQSDPALERLLALVLKAVDKLESYGKSNLLVMKEEIAATIRAAYSGPERVGVGMPLAVLAAMPDLSITLGRKYLNFIVCEDKMSALISEFDPELYQNPDFKITKDFIQKQLKKSDLKCEVSDRDVAELLEAVGRRENLNGRVAGRGVEPSRASEPFIHLVYKEPPELVSDGDVINMRDRQQRSIVQTGQLVAEIRYLKPEVIGINVLGERLPPEAAPTMEVVVGEGIKEMQVGKFYAECGGVPQCEEGHKLSLIKSHVHEGDVNLKSGNIYFDGPVEIKGSVDSGALVRVKGPVKIYGSITGGTVISKEPIEVVESIVTGSQGKVVCSTHIRADFIENSTIECDGSVVVAKSLVSSDVVAGDYVQALAADGVIGGGTILCRNLVAAANIGFAKGARTKFIVGVDHRVVRRTKIREKRLQNLTEAQERYKLEFRELAQKKESQLTPKHKQMKEILKLKMSDVRPLIETVTKQLETLKTSMTYNEDALIAATNVFASNCQVEVGGQGVVLEADTMAVGISAKKRRDSHLCTYDEIKSEIERKLAGAQAPDSPTPNAITPSVEGSPQSSGQPSPVASEVKDIQTSVGETATQDPVASVESATQGQATDSGALPDISSDDMSIEDSVSGETVEPAESANQDSTSKAS